MDSINRVTAATLDVLQSMLASDEGVWGLRLVKLTGRPSGSVYPILERLERVGWVASQWDDGSDRPGPRRRLYRLTADGALAARDLVSERRSVAAPIRLVTA